VELREFGPLTFCMPRTPVSTKAVALGPIISGQSSARVRGRRSGSGETWGGWLWVWLWFLSLHPEGGSHCRPAITGVQTDLVEVGTAKAARPLSTGEGMELSQVVELTFGLTGMLLRPGRGQRNIAYFSLVSLSIAALDIGEPVCREPKVINRNTTDMETGILICARGFCQNRQCNAILSGHLVKVPQDPEKSASVRLNGRIQ
jgi:hypothetical protein